MPQADLRATRIGLPGGAPAADSKSWPTRAEQIEIDISWTLNGATTRKTLKTDLAFGRADVKDPRFAYPFVTRGSAISRPTLEKLILVAYTGTGDDEPDAEELARDGAAARVAAEIALNADGWLTAVSSLATERLLYCLPADVEPPDGIRILLHDEPRAPVKTESYRRNDPLRKSIETDPRVARERNNRLVYESGPFKGHRGTLLGTPVIPHWKLWRTLVEMYDERRVQRPAATCAEATTATGSASCGRSADRDQPTVSSDTQNWTVCPAGHTGQFYMSPDTRQTMAVLTGGLETAFERFGGVPKELLFDQMRAVVLSDRRVGGGELVLNAEFLRFAAHSSWAEDTANVRRHGTTGERPVDRFERDEREALGPLASRPYRRLGVHRGAEPVRRRVPETVEVERRSLRVYAEAAR